MKTNKHTNTLKYSIANRRRAQIHPLKKKNCIGRTNQFDDLDKHPVVGGSGHQFEEQRSERQVVTRVLTGELANHIHCRTLYT